MSEKIVKAKHMHQIHPQDTIVKAQTLRHLQDTRGTQWWKNVNSGNDGSQEEVIV